MHTNILFPTDGSDAAEETLDYALDVAAAHDATLHLLHVADTNQDSLTRLGGEVVDVLERAGGGIVEAAAERADERGVSTSTSVLQGDPSMTIVDYVAEYDVDLVVMPTHGRRGLSRLLLGSVTERVVGAVDVPVVVVTPDEGVAFVYPPERILVATDGSAAAEEALESAVALARATGASLHLLHVVETASLGFDVRSVVAGDDLDAAGRTLLAEAASTVEAAGVDSVTTELTHGRPHREIRASIEAHDIDLLALGVHGETDFSRSVLGGVTTKVIRGSPVPVLLRRETGASASESASVK